MYEERNEESTKLLISYYHGYFIQPASQRFSQILLKFFPERLRRIRKKKKKNRNVRVQRRLCRNLLLALKNFHVVRGRSDQKGEVR